MAERPIVSARPTPWPQLFPPTREAAIERLAAADPEQYARRRNDLDGPVTRLSPYLTHGVLSTAEAIAALLARGTPAGSKLVFELAWREYWLHVWSHLGIGILRDIRRPVARCDYARALPRDVLEARTGLRVIDQAVRALYDTGYVHNHARMWLASYVVHLRKVHWRSAADWMYGHLLDGDLASNHLSWQWVAGTFSAKPYLFNRENVERHAPGGAAPGTAIDRSHAELERIARSPERLGPERGAPERGVMPPRLLSRPPEPIAPMLPDVVGRDVALVHPWSLGERLPGTVAVGVLHLPFHESMPWSVQRWSFVLRRMRHVTDAVWAGDLHALLPRLAAAKSVRAMETLNPGYRDALRHPGVALVAAPRHFAEPEELCQSFAQFWKAVAPSLVAVQEPV
jgi:deoxyribodipyrimidine photo-lyase